MLYRFRDGKFTEFTPVPETIEKVDDVTPLIEKEHDNLPVYVIS